MQSQITIFQFEIKCSAHALPGGHMVSPGLGTNSVRTAATNPTGQETIAISSLRDVGFTRSLSVGLTDQS
jgi:hypothetical protein